MVLKYIEGIVVSLATSNNFATLIVNVGGSFITVADWYVDYGTQNCLLLHEASALSKSDACEYVAEQRQAACNGDL
jgi:hypothetical protein